MSQLSDVYAALGRNMANRLARHARAVALALLPAAACALPIAAQTAERPDPLVGSWLIEPPHYDAWVETGFDVPWYPLLVLRKDGTFSLFRLAPHCQPFEADGRAVDSGADTPYRAALCADARAIAANHDVLAAYLHPGASGRWSIEAGGRLHFEIEARGAGLPHHLRGGAVDLRRDLAMRRDRGVPAAESEGLRALTRFLDVYERRIATFYSSLYVFDGDPVTVSVARGRLEMKGPNRDEILAFRAVRPSLPDAAVGLLLVLEASVARYFRCAVARLAPEWPASGHPTAGLAALAARARTLAAAGHRRAYAETLKKAGRDVDAAERWEPVHEQMFKGELRDILEHAAAKAARERRLGAFLGCPERDRD
jgi:hypothetical protein